MMCGSETCQVTRFLLVHGDSGVGLVVGTPCVWRSSRFPYSRYLLGSTVDLFISVSPRRLRTISQVSHVKLDFAFHVPLVSGSHLFGVCVARRPQEKWIFWDAWYAHASVHGCRSLLSRTVTCSVLCLSRWRSAGHWLFLEDVFTKLHQSALRFWQSHVQCLGLLRSTC